MIKFNNVDFELPTLGKEPQIGYEDEFIEKKMLSGKIRRIYKGKRFYAVFRYAYLTDAQINQLNQILTSQRDTGYISAKISTPFGDFNGNAILTVDKSTTMFKKDKETGKYVWINYSVQLKAVDLAE